MTKNNFNLIEWFNKKINDEKETINLISEKMLAFTDEIRKQLQGLKNDSHHIVPIINGLYGDAMEEKGHPALVSMSFRYNSRNIGVDEIHEMYDFSKHQGKIIVMVHGLMNDETIFQSSEIDAITRLGTFLENQNKASILYLRYNTGRHISQNGRDLSCLMEQFIDRYQDKIKDIKIIAHSMGGLVSRSAGHYANKLNHKWHKQLTKVFLIGVPNEGSYLARIAYMTQYFLRKLDPSENNTYAKFFEIRSNGIKDLSFGFLVDEDWQNPNYEIEKDIKASKIYPLEHVEYYLIAGIVSDKKSKSRIFTFFGDGLVEKESALSQLFKEKSLESGKIHFKLFEEQNHLSLLEDEPVRQYIVESLEWK